MSLIVWLPLRGSLENLGTNNYNIEEKGTTVWDNNGKIGKCYNHGVDSSKIYIKIPTNFVSELGNEYSIAVWVNPNGDHPTYNGPFISSGDWNRNDTDGYPLRWTFGLSQDNSQVDVLGPGYNKYINCPVPANTWTHLVSTMRADGTATLYKNGEFVATYKCRGSELRSTASNTTLCRASYTSYFSFNGKMNDMRIYNHALSAAEVKEIAKGLVLHYPLNNNGIGTWNLVSYKINDWGKESGITITQSANGYYHMVYSGSNTTRYGVYVNINVDANTQYTVSVRANFPASCSGGIGMMSTTADGTVSWPSGTTIPNSADGEYSYTMTTGANHTKGRIYIWIKTTTAPDVTNLFCDLSFPKLEKNDKRTEGFLRESDVLDNTTVYDTSGYGNNGTIIGTVIPVTPSPRYNCASYMDNTNTANHIETDSPLLNTEAMSVAFWVKAQKNKNQVIFADKSSTMEFGLWNSLGYTLQTHKPGWDLSTFNTNEWNHVAVIKDGDVESLYINGVKVTNRTGSSNYLIHTAINKLYLLNRNYNNTGAAQAALSDFRIYATALSAEDIKSLYETSVKIDNKQNIHAYELQESDSCELIQGLPLTESYGNTTNIFQNYDENGEITLIGNSSIGSNYIPINPVGKTYYYDIDVSIQAGNKFYFGFEQFDEDKTSTSNNSCWYAISPKPTSDLVHKRYFGTKTFTVNLSTGKPPVYLRVRILNNWSGSAASDLSATIHRMSLREVSTLQQPKIEKNGIILADEFNELHRSAFYKNGFIEANNLIEQ